MGERLMRLRQMLFIGVDGRVDLQAMREQDPEAYANFLDLIMQMIDQGNLVLEGMEEDQRPRGDPQIADSVLADEFEEDCCSICMEELQTSRIVKLPRCSHHFHAHCIRKWCETSASCPVCR